MVVDFCAKSGLCVGNIYSKLKNVRKNTGWHEIEMMIVERYILKYVHGSKIVRVIEPCISDHSVVLSKVDVHMNKK